MNLGKMIQAFNPKRALALAIGIGILTMGVDAGVAHFAGRGMKHAGQLIPVVFGSLAAVAVVAASMWAKRPLLFRRTVRGVALLTALIGALGTAYHAVALAKLVATGSGLGIALAIAPPALAPGAFVALGAMLYALVSPRVELRTYRLA